MKQNSIYQKDEFEGIYSDNLQLLMQINRNIYM